ncbi:polyphosphate kinase [Actinoplanes sp. OR16]|uniref:RNA degradosome polyphosphate kinase n=1 Tax=Actinoplanes sp. OR16 TaxID=946334 RepID=UPI000F6E3CBC|nr:RNA degradosome polyphosphate kinase [Actinoplanes sp. OR16]BBH64423.1 polyphosphate kinase [Actinoplanes sp. OR16]
MQTPPRTPEPRRRGPNGRFLRTPEIVETESAETVEPVAAPVPDAEAKVKPEVETVEIEEIADKPAEEPPYLGIDRLETLATDEAAEAFEEDVDDDDDDESAESVDGDRYYLPSDRFLNRELSWLDFNARVLALAEDPATPLLERAKFLAIFASNLDEFYMVRVAGLKRRLSAGLPVRGGDRSPLRQQIEMITERAADLVTRHAACFADEVRPKLAAESIEVVSWKELDAPEQGRLRTFFREQVFPVLTPLAVDPAHPFPYISSRSLNLAVALRYPDGDNPELFARIKVPNNVSRFVTVQNDSRGVRFLPIEELIANHLDQLFPGMQILEVHAFRVTRNAELEVDEDRDEDLLQALEREIAQRRFGPPVRLEVAASISDHVLDLLVRELDMDSHDVLRVPGLLDLSALWQVFGEVDRDDLKDRPFVPATHPQLADGEVPRSVFNRLRESDILVHHPYHSFSTSVQRFIEQAAADPNVLAIKQTLYRTSGDSPIVDALVDAAAAGKQVVVLVEVKARFDEVANIAWARKLERAGCHVVYGLVGLKTHCKTALVVRQEGNQIRRYCHIGTGNYHPKTARLYEDFGMLTADPEVGADVTDLFNVLTGYSRQTTYRRLLVAPHGVRKGLVERIEEQAKIARDGGEALVQFKVNSLVDEQTIDALYKASQDGVKIDLIIRGMCSLRPGVPGLSENIRVRSIVGRFLEHSRVFRFGPGPEAEYWMGSADLMHRNLDRRVEALVRINLRSAREELRNVLELSMRDQTEGWDLDGEGVWNRNLGTPGRPQNHLQAALLRRVIGKKS